MNPVQTDVTDTPTILVGSTATIQTNKNMVGIDVQTAAFRLSTKIIYSNSTNFLTYFDTHPPNACIHLSATL